MSYYEKCASLLSKSSSVAPAENCSSSLEVGAGHESHNTLPSIIRESPPRQDEKAVYYISDLHLAHHIVRQFPNGAEDDQVRKYIHKIVLCLFSGDFLKDLSRFHSPIVLFGGDISSNFSIAEFFFQDFLAEWECIVDAKYNLFFQEFEPLTTELAAVTSEIDDWCAHHPWVASAQKALSEYSDRKVPQRIKQLLLRQSELKSIIHEKRQALHLDYLWEENYQKTRNHKYIYCILGNHEFWDFESYDRCDLAYSALFSRLGILYLNDSISWLGPHELPRIQNYLENTAVSLLGFNNVLIVGGLGYSPLNDSFNASQGIYGLAIGREEELQLSESFRTVFRSALRQAHEQHTSLVILTHMPLSDWYDGSDDVSNCIFFTGHTHRNLTMCGDDNSFIFADNQVGYTSESIEFKKALLYAPRNPFAADPDGYREISCTEYKEFYLYMRETLPGTGTIERQAELYGGKLFVLKKDGFYAFFFSSPKGVYICNGGQLIKIGKPGSLDLYFDNLMVMVDHYITELSPLRRLQEQLSGYVKSFGGTGKIHGTIVDINFTNHIMIDVEHKALSFYNSPVFGWIKAYPDLGTLLHVHCKELEESYRSQGNTQLTVISDQVLSKISSDYVPVDIRNSPYKVSRKINPLHRLFEKNILRAWDPDFEQVFAYEDNS